MVVKTTLLEAGRRHETNDLSGYPLASPPKLIVCLDKSSECHTDKQICSIFVFFFIISIFRICVIFSWPIEATSTKRKISFVRTCRNGEIEELRQRHSFKRITNAFLRDSNKLHISDSSESTVSDV